MIKNYFKIAFRNIIKQKGHSFINITGLAIGMACSLLILMWVQNELSFDRFNEHADEIYRVVENQYYAGGEVFPVAVTPAPLAPALKEEYPEIIKSTRFSFRTLTIEPDPKQTNEMSPKLFSEGAAFADADIFDIFTFTFISGNPQNALSDPHSIILTEDASKKFFGNEDALGKFLRIDNKDNFKVTAVIKNIPDNSHLKYDMLAPFIYLEEFGNSMENWGSNWCYTYIRLQENTPYQEIDKKIIDFIKKRRENSVTDIYLQPLTKIHLYSSGKYTADIGGHGDIQYINIFSVIALFVLLIACINFMNLATARSEKRAKEVGIRKVVGAQRHQLIKQFFGEAIFLAMIAFIAALILVIFFLPAFNDLSGKTLQFTHLDNSLIFTFFAIALISGLISGVYPALFLSSFRPIETLKSGKKTTSSGGSLLRKALVILQFTLSVIMIIGTLVISKQIDYIHHKNLGLDKENIGYIWMSSDLRQQSDAIKEELLKNPNITNVTRTSQLPTYVGRSSSGYEWEGKNPDDVILMHEIFVDDDYLQTFKMKMATGRFFSPEFSSDTMAVVINQKAADLIGIKDPLGKKLSDGNNNFTIIGIVQDFHFKPIRTVIEPLVLYKNPHHYYAMIMRTQPQQIKKTVNYVEQTFKKFNPKSPFYFNFLDESYDSLYRTEERAGKLSGYFAAIAILIASLGLYGLASYMLEQRTKEIGIRKVLGASIPAIFILLSRNFILLVGIANIIAWPVAYFIMSGWLQNYAYRTSLQALVFISATFMAFFIVIITIGYQALKASTANPVKSLRYE